MRRVTCRVVAAIFEAFETIDENFDDLSTRFRLEEVDVREDSCNIARMKTHLKTSRKTSQHLVFPSSGFYKIKYDNDDNNSDVSPETPNFNTCVAARVFNLTYTCTQAAYTFFLIAKNLE